MDQKLNSTSGDILDETYEGPGAVVTAAGKGYIAHFYYAIAGLVGGGIASYIFHKPVNRLMAKWKASGMVLAESESFFKSVSGKFSGWLVGFSEGTMSDARSAVSSISNPKVKDAAEKAIAAAEGGFIHSLAYKFVKLGKWLSSPFSNEKMSGAISKTIRYDAARADAAMLGGGLLGTAGFFLSPLLYAPGGVAQAGRGRKQFERLKTEVADLREQNDEWKDRYVEAKLALEKTTQHPGHSEDNLVVAPDQPPEMQSAPSEEGLASLDALETKPPHREAPKPTLDATHSAHHGKLHHDHTQEIAHA